MYDRAPRELSKASESTSVTVGPGTYDPSFRSKNAPGNKADGYAPFSSMTTRESFLTINDQVIAAPGPGHYDPQKVQDMVKGGRTLANKSKRFSTQYSDTPGPGAYSVVQNPEWYRPSKSAPDLSRNKGGLLMMNRVRFHRKVEAPSIPSQGQAYGYEEREDGTLRKQDPPERDDSLGPAFYKAGMAQTKPTKQYKGIHFGKLTSKRTDFTGKDGPGPGEYEPYVDRQLNPENLNAIEEEHQRFESHLPRYHELVVKDEEKKAVPGPGKYEVKGQFVMPPPKLNPDGAEVEHPPFLSQSKRFYASKEYHPAPGTYNDPRNAFELLKRVTGLKRSPFSQTAVRFADENPTKKNPGPGSYNIIGLGSESMKKAYMESTRRGVFGTTSVRVQGMNKKENNDLPGPAHYQVKEKPFKSRYQQPSSTFSSMTSRFIEPLQSVAEVPSPGFYEVGKSYEKSQIKLDRAKPRNEAASKKQSSFLTGASRFAPPRSVIIKGADADTPGPGAYEGSHREPPKGGLMTTRDKRFKDITTDTPGPGQYEFSPLIQDTVLKGTFNATLSNPLATQMETIHAAPSNSKHAFLLGV